VRKDEGVYLAGVSLMNTPLKARISCNFFGLVEIYEDTELARHGLIDWRAKL
jgi:hypothetical protein